MVDSRATIAFEVLKGWKKKLKGLLGTNEDANPVALCGCSSVHTFGMKYALDVALVSRNGAVLASKRAVPPRRVMSARGAHYALERPCCEGPWPTNGTWVSGVECRKDRTLF